MKIRYLVIYHKKLSFFTTYFQWLSADSLKPIVKIVAIYDQNLMIKVDQGWSENHNLSEDSEFLTTFLIHTDLKYSGHYST